jgi:hypothetical protein
MPLLFYPRLFGNDAAVEGGGGSAPAIPALSIENNGNGTATATVSGSTAGSTNEVEVIGLGSSGSESWTNAGSRSGDGTVTLTLANGSYSARCQSTLAGVAALDSSNAFNFTITGATPSTTYNSPHAALAHSVQATIIGLLGTRITGVVSDSVRVRKIPYGVDFASVPVPGQHALPGILIVYSDKEADLGGLNNRDDLSYPLTIVFAAKDVTSQGVCDPEGNDDLYVGWRQTISDVLRHRPYAVSNYAPGTITFDTCFIEYGPIVDWARWQKDQIFVGAMTLRFTLRRSRG